MCGTAVMYGKRAMRRMAQARRYRDEACVVLPSVAALSARAMSWRAGGRKVDVYWGVVASFVLFWLEGGLLEGRNGVGGGRGRTLMSSWKMGSKSS